MKDNKKIVMEQARFCKDLMDRLCLSVEKILKNQALVGLIAVFVIAIK